MATPLKGIMQTPNTPPTYKNPWEDPDLGSKSVKEQEDALNASGKVTQPFTQALPTLPVKQAAPAQLTPDASVKNPLGRDVHVAPPEEKQLGTAAQASADFDKNMPGYIAGQVGGAEDSARMALANDIQKNKEQANSRGLLYSGLEAGGEANAKAHRGAELGSAIQGINQSANALSNYKKAQAVNESALNDTHDVAMAGLQATANQTAYEQALNEINAQNSYYSDIMGGIGKLAGAGLGVAVAGA